MKKCPNCEKMYRDFDQYCLVCRYKLQYIEGTEKVEYCPEPHELMGNSGENIPKCPTCQSTNIRKMSAVESGASIFAFGIFSKKINKTFKCSNCGYTW